MKKTMFITSVIMVIVLAVALTTSSLAWFSASGNATVYTDTLKLTAKATSSSGIAISHDGSLWENEIELRSGADINTNLMPLVPYNKAATPTADRLLAALVGGREAPAISLADFAADYAKYVDDSEETVATYEAVYAAAAEDSASEWGDLVDSTGAFGGDIIDEEEYEDFEGGILLEGKDGINDDFAAYYQLMIDNGYISAQDVKGVTETGTYIDRDAFMIGNKIDFNSLFTDNLYRDGYYTDTMYIKNLATGTGAQSVNLNTLISFYFSTPVTTDEVDPDSGMPIIRYETYNYQRTYRGDKYDLDPTLCVAVIAKKNTATNGVFLTDAEYVTKLALEEQLADKEAEIAALDPEEDEYEELLAEKTAEKEAIQAQIDALTDYEWEIVAYAESKGSPAGNYIPSTLNMGKEAVDFAEGAVSGSSTATLSTTGLNKTNSVALRGDHTYSYLEDPEDESSFKNIEIGADVLEVKVIAWYDGSTLNNNNSNDGTETSDYMRGSANIEFKLSFITAE